MKIIKFNLPVLNNDLTSSVEKFKEAKKEWVIDRFGNYTKLTIPKGTVSIIEETGYKKLFQTFETQITDAKTKTFSKFWYFISQFEQNKSHIEEHFQYLIQTRGNLIDKWNTINLSIMNEVMQIRKSYDRKAFIDQKHEVFINEIERVYENFNSDNSPSNVYQNIIKPLKKVFTSVENLPYHNNSTLPNLFEVSETNYNSMVQFFDVCQLSLDSFIEYLEKGE